MQAHTLVAMLSFLVFAPDLLTATQAESIAPRLDPVVTLPQSMSVPMELPDGRAIVTVALNGHGPYRLAVETGSPDVLISPKLISELGLSTIGPGETDSMFRLDSLRIGAALIRTLPVGRDDAFLRLGVDGVLGLLAFRDVQLIVDYPAQRLTLARERLPKPDGREVLAATRVGPFLGIPVTLGKVKETGVIDTQGGVGFQAVDEVAGRLSFQSPPRVVGRAVVGGGPPVEVKVGVLQDDAMIGQHRIRHPRIAVHPLPPDIPSRVTIGIGVLRHFTVAIDQRSMAVRLTRPDTAAIEVE